ncbi:MAG: radical SAM protein [Deltaproteobacteria bacterium]|nr:radical SAM protein [Deltaproteobacteria bacterium]
MKILLANPPNAGRSIPEEKYGISSIKQIMRGEPLALEVLAGNLPDHDVVIVDLKVDPLSLAETLRAFEPDVVGITGTTCEANTMVRLARETKENCNARVVVGGVHASLDPKFFNVQGIDFVVVGLAKQSFRELVMSLEERDARPRDIPGVAPTHPGEALQFTPRAYDKADLVDDASPRYDLVHHYRAAYFLPSLQMKVGFVSSTFGCPFACVFCSIGAVSGHRYLTHSIPSVIRDIEALGNIPFIRLVDANTFGDSKHSLDLCHGIRDAGIQKNFVADVRADSVIEHPALFREWKAIGLRAVVVGFEAMSDLRLKHLNKKSTAAKNKKAIEALHDMGITIVGDFIISPDYTQKDFDELEQFITESDIRIPMLSILTPIPGTPLFEELKKDIVIHDLDYYTLTNAVIPTRMEEGPFYSRYADFMNTFHANAGI